MKNKKPKRSEIAFKKAFVELLLNESRDKIFIRSICDKAGYTTMCFYQNYESKEDLIHSILKDELDVYLNHLSEFSRLVDNGLASKDECIKILKKYFEYIYANRDLYTCIFNSKFSNNTEQYYELEIAKRFIDKFDPNHIKFSNYNFNSYEDIKVILEKNVDYSLCNSENDYMIWFIVRNKMLNYLFAKKWCQNGYNLTPSQIAECCYKVFLLMDNGTIISKYNIDFMG